jgi:acylphosphatase
MNAGPLRLRITGRVQGVGYRASLAQMATAHGLRGWVRNRLDGSVEAVLSGPADACDAVIRWSHRGPPLARVDDVRVTADAEDADLPAGFDFRPTA